MHENKHRQNHSKTANGSKPGEGIQEDLLTRLDRLRSELASDSISPDELADGWQDRGSASESALRDVEFSHRGDLLQRILQIDHALERIKEKTYGCCDRCGQGIDPARLLHEPGALFCLACQGRLEGERASLS